MKRSEYRYDQKLGYRKAKEQGITADDLIEALDLVAHYNGIAELIYEWRNIEPENGGLLPIYAEQSRKYSGQPYDQLQIFWMICVILFGDYGTSPRSGWIDKHNVRHFREFIERITQTWRGAEEE